MAVSALNADRAHDDIAELVLDIGDDLRALAEVVAAARVAGGCQTIVLGVRKTSTMYRP